jgi:DNA-binding MarR family transcriptional regulator
MNVDIDVSRLPKLGSIQLYALALIAKSDRSDPPNLTRLKKQLGVPSATITMATVRLAADGYIDQTRHGSSVCLSLTTKGAALLERLVEIFRCEESVE